MKNNFTKLTNKIISIAMGIFLSGCQFEKTIQGPMNSQYVFQVNENIATAKHPSIFYLCDNARSSCNAVTNRWSGDVSKQLKKPKKYLVSKKSHNRKSALIIKKSWEKLDGNIATKDSCIAKGYKF